MTYSQWSLKLNLHSEERSCYYRSSKYLNKDSPRLGSFLWSFQSFMMYFSFLASFGSWAITNDTEHSTRGEDWKLFKYCSGNLFTICLFLSGLKIYFFLNFFFFLSETLNNILREFIQEYMAINSMLQKIRS